MRKNNDIVEAATIWWADYVDSDSVSLANSDNPEKQYMLKEMMEKMSSEAKELVDVIVNLPDEMFLVNGKLIQKKFISYMKQKFGWTAQKVTIVQSELQLLR